MSLTHRIAPGDALDGSKVQENFVALEALAEGIRSRNVDQNNIDTQHMASTWTDVRMETAAGPTAFGGVYAVMCASGINFSVTSGVMFEALCSLSVRPTVAPWVIDLDVRVDGVAIFTTQMSSSSALEDPDVFIPVAFVATAATHTVEIWGRITAGAAAWNTAKVVVVAPRR